MKNQSVPVLRHAVPLVATCLALMILLFGFRVSRAQSIETSQGTQAELAQNTPAPTATEAPSWIILPTMPITATQADYGAEIYRLVCKACHGDRGQGLTGDWIVQWPPEDQNCWQAKCHHETIHPPDGFALPHFVPAVIGPNRLARYETALDLYEYNRNTMPWHVPGSMLDEEYWQVTAYLLRENGIDPLPEPLDAERAANLRLSPAAVVTQAVIATQEPSTSGQPESTPGQSSLTQPRNTGFIWAIAALLAIALAILLVVRRR